VLVAIFSAIDWAAGDMQMRTGSRAGRRPRTVKPRFGATASTEIITGTNTWSPAIGGFAQGQGYVVVLGALTGARGPLIIASRTSKGPRYGCTRWLVEAASTPSQSARRLGTQIG
jgi:hypothetical protein